MADRPIIFSAPMVRALLDGRKSQTRRLAKVKWKDGANRDFSGWRPERVGASHWWIIGGMGVGANIAVPYAPGDRLWVREAWCALKDNPHSDVSRLATGIGVAYRATDDDEMTIPPRWRSPIHMPRWASRLTLIVTEVRVQRLRDISEADAAAEGVTPIDEPNELRWEHYAPHGVAFRDLWNSLHGPEAWDANPWVAAISFTVHKANIDAMEAADARG